MRKILAVAIKEMRQASRDPLSLAMLLGVPAMMLLLYGFALSFDVRHVRFAIQDLDRSPESRDLVAAFVRSTYFDLVADLPASVDPERFLERREAKAILVIPEGFGGRIAAAREAKAQLLVDGTDAMTASTLLSYAMGVIETKNVELLAAQRAIEYEPRVWYNPELESVQFLVPGLVGFILMLTAAIAMALSVVREKERGTMEQLLVTSLRPGQLVIGKLLPYLVLSLAATAIIFLVARVLFGVVVRGGYLHLFAATLLYLLGALGWGLLVSSLVRTQAVAYQVATLTSMLPAIFLSGFIFPIRSMPAVLQAITRVVPARYYLTVLRGIVLKGEPITTYLGDVLFLAAFAAVVLGLAWMRLVGQGVRDS